MNFSIKTIHGEEENHKKHYIGFKNAHVTAKSFV